MYVRITVQKTKTEKKMNTKKNFFIILSLFIEDDKVSAYTQKNDIIV
jgi:hypothetical protein